MDYGLLIRQSWTTTWQHRFLWLLGLFAGGAGASTCASGGQGQGTVQYQLDKQELQRVMPDAEHMAEQAASWVLANAGMLLALGVVIVLVLLALLALSFIAQGGMAFATVALAEGRPVSWQSAWGAGLRLVWRYVGMWLLLVMLAVVIAFAVGAVVTAFVVLASAIDESRWLLVLLAVLLGLPLVPAAILLAIGISIASTYAQRAVVVENAGPLDALRSGVRLVRAQFTESLLVWLVSVALGIGAGIAVILVLGTAVLLLGVVGVGLWYGLDLTTPTVIYMVTAAVASLTLYLTLSAVSNTFFWNYWTMAYLRLSELAAPRPDA